MQNSYILLRNNKESGALSIEELLQIGLKETDLIWIECQSWDWRSPKEIPELKGLLVAGDQNGKIDKTEGEIMATRQHSAEGIYNLPKRDVGMENFEKYGPPEMNGITGFEKKETYSQSASVSWVLPNSQAGGRNQNTDGYKKNTLTIQLPGQVKKWTLYACLVFAGALIMLAAMKLGSKKGVIAQQKISAPENSILSVDTIQSAAVTNPVIPPANFGNAGPVSNNSPDTITRVRKTKVPVSKSLQVAGTSVDSQSFVSNVAEKNIKPVVETKIKSPGIDEISSKIVLTANNYKVGFMGGVRDLAITLQNNSPYLLNKAAVKVDYINSAGEIVNTDQIDFQSVKAGDAKVLEVNKSKRGVKVRYYIIAIECKELGLPS